MATRKSGVDWLSDAICIAGLIAAFGLVWSHWAELPMRVPKHFGISGAPDGWGSKQGLWLVPSVATGLYLLLTAVSRHREIMNLPAGIDRDSPEVISVLGRMFGMVRILLVLTFLYLTWASVSTALGQSTGLGMLFLPATVGALLTTVVYSLFRLRALRFAS
jgi:hypothetical protein